MRLNLYEADDDDIEEYYLDNIDKGMKEEDVSLSPSSLENEQRCLLLADTLSAFFAHVSGRPFLKPLTLLSRCIISWDGNK